MRRERAKASAPGKVILWGEHFVVYGSTAVVTAIDCRVDVVCSLIGEGVSIRSGRAVCSKRGGVVRCSSSSAWRTLHPLMGLVEAMLSELGGADGVEVVISSDMPRGAGLGSSAAVSAATAKALSTLLGHELSPSDVKRWAMRAEQEIHGRPSGIDPHITTVGGTLTYRRPDTWESIELPSSLRLLVIDTGERRSTGKLVEKVSRFAAENREIFEELKAFYDELVKEALDTLKTLDLKRMGELMRLNQLLLRAVGVSTEDIERAVEVLQRSGAYGAKLTGAGGGGCVIAVAEDDELEKICERTSRAFPRVWVARCSEPGVRVEEE